MDKFLLITLLMFTASVNAVSMENNTFAIDAEEIHFKPGEITAKRHVILRIKSLETVTELASRNNIALSQLAANNHSIHISLADGWQLKGRVLAIAVDGETAIIEANELLLHSNQLVAHKL